jgi:hypothetical protein
MINVKIYAQTIGSVILTVIPVIVIIITKITLKSVTDVRRFHQMVIIAMMPIVTVFAIMKMIVRVQPFQMVLAVHRNIIVHVIGQPVLSVQKVRP